MSSVHAESVSTRNTLTLSDTSALISLIVANSEGSTTRHATSASVDAAVATPTASFVSCMSACSELELSVR